jgi:hypothetical protein
MPAVVWLTAEGVTMSTTTPRAPTVSVQHSGAYFVWSKAVTLYQKSNP